MALPVTLSSPTIAVHNAYHGPFKSSGGNFYTILCGTTAMSSVWAVQDGDNIHVIFTHDSTATHNLTAWKATDPTSSFAEQDTSNRPSTGGGDSDSIGSSHSIIKLSVLDLGYICCKLHNECFNVTSRIWRRTIASSQIKI
ncbi:hypothetical protein LCGC14_2819290 [marine sediment metagenome]|uniref:Uncharacterized protein n=1 Tax=marine sediment metagenome TaxID=412755 RepID=A0A0F8YHJ5_9ZZZZ